MLARHAAAASLLAAALLPAAVFAQDPPAAPASRQAKVYMVCPLLKAHKDSEMHAVPIKVNGLTLYACNDVTAKLFRKEPLKIVKGELTDPVTGKSFTISDDTPWAEHRGVMYLFASPDSKATFLKSPARYTKSRPATQP